MIHPNIFLMVAAFSSCLLIGISCGQTDDRSLQDSIFTPIGGSVLESQATGIAELARCKDCPPKCDECPFSPFYAIWTLNKYGSQRWCLNTAENVLQQNGYNVIDPAADQNVHVLARRSNPEVIITVVCTRIAQLQTSVVIFGVSPDENAVQADAARIRDQIESIRSREGDVVQNPVQD